MSQHSKSRLRQFGAKAGVKDLMEQKSIFALAMKKAEKKTGPLSKAVKRNFDSLMQVIGEAAQEIYFREENRYVSDILTALIRQKVPHDADRDAITAMLLEHERDIAELYLSLIQGRKNRAGKTLEKVISILFDELKLISLFFGE